MLLLITAVGVWACGNATTPSPSPSAAASAEASTALQSTPASAGTEPSASVETQSSGPTDSIPPLDSPSPSASDAGPVAGCSGTSGNRDFFSGVAAAVDWPVYCAALPGGWFVDTGRYRLARGGWMEIAYKGPSGARLELHEGSFCQAADGCVPAGTDAGPAPFGDQSGTRVQATDGRFAVVVQRAGNPSWLAIGSGLTEDVFLKYVGRLIRLD